MSSLEINKASTMIELLYIRAKKNPEQPAYTFLHDKENQVTTLTYGELLSQVNAIAVELRKRNLQGERALILFPSNLDFLVAFLACMSAGVVAVPAYPPRKNQNMGRIKSIINDCAPALVLANTKIMGIAKPILQEESEFRSLQYLCTDNKDIFSESEIVYPSIDPESLAFLQYTSGSTGDPKGVMLSHANLFYNQKVARAAGGDKDHGNIVSWLPLYHDMGLGMALLSITTGGHCTLMSPAAFIIKPQRWLWAISKNKAYISGAPNFAFEHCLKMMRPEQYDGLDLSSWKVAFCGAEPVKASTIKKFTEAFEPYGYTSKTLSPSYGLAEATVAVTMPCVNTEAKILYLDRNDLSKNKVTAIKEGEGADAYVDCGKTRFDDELLIVDPDTHQICQHDTVGEIWLKSKSNGSGYWKRPKISKEIFKAKVKGKDGHYLRTGDLGFLQKELLFVTGRIKDLLIIRGRNYYPHDIENHSSCSSDVLNNNFSAAVTSNKDGDSKLILIHEVEREFVRKLKVDENLRSEVIEKIRQAISSEFELQVGAIVLLKPGRIPKTSSGKVQRKKCLSMYEAKDFEPIFIWSAETENKGRADGEEISNDHGNESQARAQEENKKSQLSGGNLSQLPTSYLSFYNEIKNWIENWVGASQKIKPELVDINKEFTSYGMDSIEIMKLTGELGIWLDTEISADTVWDYLTIHKLSEYLAKNKNNKRGELEELKSIPIQDRNTVIDFPLSNNQERLWFLQQLGGDLQVYDIEGVYRIKGELNHQALESAFNYLVNRHEAFSTEFSDESGEIKQALKIPKWDYKLDQSSNSSSVNDQKYISTWLADGRKDKFNLTEGALLKVRLLRQSQENNILQVRIHHMISDGWSLSLFVKELAICYDAFSQNKTPKLPTLIVKYLDYIIWQQSLIDELLITDGLKYWKSKLENSQHLELPTDFARPPVQSYNGLHKKIHLSRSMTEELKKFGRKENATLYNVLLAAFKILLSKYSGQSDICIGAPIANRAKVGSDSIVGMLVNTLPLRTEIGDNDSFITVLNKVKTTTKEAYKYQSVSFSQIIDELNLSRDQSRPPFFQTMFVMQNTSITSDFKTNSIALEEIEFESGSSKFDITMELVEDDGEISGWVEFNTDLFHQNTIERLIGHYKTLLANILVDPLALGSTLQILTSKEKEFLYNCNKTQQEYEDKVCVHKAFENQVEKTPGNIAIEIGNECLTYDELNKQANLVCSWLLSKKLKIGNKVGVCVSRSINLMPAILGTLKAGCTYVPMDPKLPESRLKAMAKEVDLDALIIENESFNKSEFENPILDVVKDKSNLNKLSTENSRLDISPENLLYLIFTSGSTGKPKCAGVVHRSAMNLYTWYADEFSMTEADRCLVISAIGFDLTQKNLFAPLLNGAKIILTDVEEYDAGHLAEVINKNKVTWLNCAPSAFYPIIETPDQQKMLESLNKVFLGGESIQVDRIKPWLKSNEVELINSYGPTECTDVATYHRVDASKIEKNSSVSIGKANPNVQIYVVDKMLNQLPVGVPGELFIGGVGVGTGYYNDEKLTEEKFVANPFYEDNSGHSMRLYKTGDKVKRLESGNFEFIGRFDNQVKLRGFRIELGEIENILNSFSDIKESAVKVCTSNKGMDILAAYFVPFSEAEISNKDLKDRLGEFLPDYMVPVAYMKLKVMPLTLNGKINKKALPEILEFDSAVDYVKPESATEIALEAIWSEILAQEKIGIKDSFFDIGGHSLLATKIVSRAKNIFDVELSVKALFSEATIQDMSLYIDTLIKAKEDVCNGAGNGTDGREEIEL